MALPPAAMMENQHATPLLQLDRRSTEPATALRPIRSVSWSTGLNQSPSTVVVDVDLNELDVDLENKQCKRGLVSFAAAWLSTLCSWLLLPCQYLTRWLTSISAGRYTRKQLSAILLYGGSSFGIVVLNKAILSTSSVGSGFGFQAAWTMAATQQFITVLCILITRTIMPKNTTLSFAVTSWSCIKKYLPLSVLFSMDLQLGLMALTYVTIPMMTILRRLSLLCTAAMQYAILGETKPRRALYALPIMVLGAVIAGAGDLTFSAIGYAALMAQNITTAARQTAIKLLSKQRQTPPAPASPTLAAPPMYARLASSPASLQTPANKVKPTPANTSRQSFETLYYNSLLSIPILALGAYFSGEFLYVQQFPHLFNPQFQLCILISSLNALLVNYSAVLCTIETDQTTTAVTGQAKNLVTVLFDLCVMNTLHATPLMVSGLTVGAVGSVMYFMADELNRKQAVKTVDTDNETVSTKNEVESTRCSPRNSRSSSPTRQLVSICEDSKC